MSEIDLFKPLQLGPNLFKNRMVMAPLTRNRSTPEGVPHALNVEYYRQRASAGLILSEATCIMPEAVGYPLTPGIWNTAQVEGWKTVTEAVHAAGGKIFCQLWHVGRISHPDLQPDGKLPVAPSAIKPAGDAVTLQGPKPFVTPRALATDELPGIVTAYRNATRNALEAGFDGVEVHAANGYLLDEFLRDGTNRRQDAYGGGIDNRARLLLEVLAAVCEVCASNRVGIRLSPVQPFNDMRDSDPKATFTRVVELLNQFDLAYLHITEMGRDAPGAAGPFFDPLELRAIWTGVFMTNAGYDKTRANAVLAGGQADLVAFGVPFIANPDLPERYRRDAALNVADPSTFYGGAEKGYTDYPSLT
ncbi:MAG: alkene reductase [Hydrogenophilales bacterium 28-61-23]|nr:MAG: alkene reductase [Hydrogenophilales bacterium 28-61-23]